MGATSHNITSHVQGEHRLESEQFDKEPGHESESKNPAKCDIYVLRSCEIQFQQLCYRQVEIGSQFIMPC